MQMGLIHSIQAKGFSIKKNHKNKQTKTNKLPPPSPKTNQKAEQMKYVFNRLSFRDYLSLYVFTMHFTISWKMKVCFVTCAIKENRIQLNETIKQINV